MSHATVLVAVDVVNPTDREEIEAAVHFQMEPYDENGTWFRDGSRWDWYVIGGRATGFLTGYDPTKDPRNIQTCWLCAGSGIRPGGLQQFGQEWFDACHGCNGCNGAGKSVTWPTQFAPYDGDILQVKHFRPDSSFRPAYAFLRERHWHEGERLGWFGGSAKTECELKQGDDPEVLTRRCLTIGDENARIVTWMEPYEIWQKSFLERFIAPLPPETVLVVVDYHV